ncbi:hypothetical protein [Actinokineospora inagensis]|uniref:hypothetical protein n=1 Tax=Actinokineospora inagensis TaxID=103730 RepID=UPI00040B65A2|nr:hypothetical protein [Actinokineospora inagensis]
MSASKTQYWIGWTVAALVTAAASVAASAVAADATPSYTAQARAAGLSAAQAKDLQATVNGYIAKTGGRQIAANEIALDGATIYVALPGERTARDLSTGNQLAGTCNYLHMCAWQYPNYTGTVIDMFACHDYAIPWADPGSWINNQRTGTVARFLDSNHNTGWSDPGAFSQDPNAPWWWVFWIRDC